MSDAKFLCRLPRGISMHTAPMVPIDNDLSREIYEEEFLSLLTQALTLQRVLRAFGTYWANLATRLTALGFVLLRALCLRRGVSQNIHRRGRRCHTRIVPVSSPRLRGENPLYSFGNTIPSGADFSAFRRRNDTHRRRRTMATRFLLAGMAHPAIESPNGPSLSPKDVRADHFARRIFPSLCANRRAAACPVAYGHGFAHQSRRFNRTHGHQSSQAELSHGGDEERRAGKSLDSATHL